MLFLLNFWDMAKLVRRLTLNQVSAGSSPAIPIKMNDEKISLLNAWEIFCFVGAFPVFSSIFQYLRKIILIVGIGRKLLKMMRADPFLKSFLVVAMRVIVLLI